jgi:hypothetical protein
MPMRSAATIPTIAARRTTAVPEAVFDVAVAGRHPVLGDRLLGRYYRSSVKIP